MNIYLYAAGDSIYADKLRDLIERTADQAKVIRLPADFPFSTYLKIKIHSGDVMILVVTDELDQLLKMKGLLTDFRIILVLADSSNVAVAHQLMPRYLTFVENDTEEIIRVLERMTSQRQS
jgi:hypothetical protein